MRALTAPWPGSSPDSELGLPSLRDHCPELLLPNQTWVRLPTCSKASLLTPGCGEGQCSIYCRRQARSPGQLVLKSPELPEGFQGKVYKEGEGRGLWGV